MKTIIIAVLLGLAIGVIDALYKIATGLPIPTWVYWVLVIVAIAILAELED